MMYRLFGLLLITVFVLAGCGAGGEIHSKNYENESSSPPTNVAPEEPLTVALNGRLVLATFQKPGDQEKFSNLQAVSSWANTTIQILDAWGNILNSTSADSNGNFSLTAPPGKNYFLRAVSGNMVLKAIIEDLYVDINGILIGPTSTAVVNVLGVLLENPNIGDPGVNISGALAEINVAVTVTDITLNANLDELSNALLLDIEQNYNPEGSVPSVGNAGGIGGAIADQIVQNITTPDTVAPTVFVTRPAIGETGVDSFSSINVTFSEAMASASFDTTSINVSAGAVNAPGTFTVNGRNLVFHSSTPLSPNTLYTVKIGGAVHDTSGNPMGTDFLWSFTTANNTEPSQTLQVSSGTGHSVLLKSDGTLWAWGRDFSGVADGGTNNYRPVPEQLFIGHLPVGTYWKEISTKGYHNFALKTDGSLWAWGSNDFGQLGDGSYIERATPVKIGDNNWKHIFSGRTHVAGIKTDGSLWTWGSNSVGQLGDGSSASRNSPVRVGMENSWEQAALGSRHSVAIKSDGTLWAWGSGEGVGAKGFDYSTTPVQISAAKDWMKVAVSGTFSMALKTDGTLWVWGSNASGQLGNATTTSVSVPTKVGTASDWTDLSTGGDWWDGQNFTLAIKKDGTLWAWGANKFGQLGDNSTIETAIPQKIGPYSDWKSLGAGDTHAVAIKNDGTVWTWGNNKYSALGNGLPSSKKIPALVGDLTSWTSLESGSGYSLGLRTGQLLTWGENVAGQLGTGTKKNMKDPVIVGSGPWARATGGVSHTLAIKEDGTLWAWGNNDHGQLGDSTDINRLFPVQVGLGYSWLEASTLAVSTLALQGDGTLWAWGGNTFGELGIGPVTVETFTPLQVGISRWKTISAGDFHVVAIRDNGTLWAWGNNDSGQLGDGTELNRYLPSQIGSENTWLMVSAGDDYTLALKSDGTLWAWGDNVFGQLGDGSNVNRGTPTQVGTGVNWSVITSGDGHTLALKTDGTLWAWGNNDYSQLGDGTDSDRNTPTQIGQDSDWASVSGGRYHSTALKDDGTLWAWGGNESGQLGNGLAWKTTPGMLTRF